MKAHDLIKTGETAVAIFTRGGHFIVHKDGRGETGNWVMNPRKRLDRVIIYKRDPNGAKHEVYIGTVIDIVESEQAGRWKIEMANIEFAGTTALNWNEFTETKQGAVNPIKYISDEQTSPTKHQATKRSAVRSETTITPSQLGDWRREMIQLLNRIDGRGATRKESVAARIARLSRAGLIPREVATMMHAVREMRNVAEYQRPLSPDQAAAARAAWNIVQEWARKRLESVSLNDSSGEST